MLLALTGANAALAEGFVLSFQPDGRLTSTTPQLGFAQTYVDGIGQRRPEPVVYTPNVGPEPTRPSRAIPGPEILSAIQETAQRYGGHSALRRAGLSVSDWQILFQANIEIESAYRPLARSPVGAIGLGQLMPATAAQLNVDPHDWRANLDGSARYLLMMLAQFGTPELALAAYNAGPDAVTRHGGIPPYRETQNHVRRVMAVVERLSGAS
ncbi:lytic transglycosylase domain-containing protein [Thalassobius sp. I31.1]|uniref:lytic transglycosylase domain-containing protein n=1 Tax=Thalassobius sp. I31.1 TaxID=2109912 RepID=UPI001E615664|nr:lytic transglycosylase domain-containing protein [Thalassobius sp. I31.1]